MAYRHDVVPLTPVTKPPYHGGYGSAAVPAGLTSVFVCRPSGGPTRPLTLVDLASGREQTVRRFPGLLRAGVVDDSGAWLLGTHGLMRVSLPDLSLVRTIRRGLPDQAVYLYDLGSGRLAVSRFKGASLTLIDTENGDAVRRLRLPPAEQLIGSPEGWWLYSAEEGAALLLDPETLKVRRRAKLPAGRFSIATDSAVFVAAGPRTPVMGELTNQLYNVSPERIVRVNRATLEVEATSEILPRLQRPIAVDPAGVLHLEVGGGLVALDVDTLAVVGRAKYPMPRWASWHPHLSAVMLVEQRNEREHLHLFRWNADA